MHWIGRALFASALLIVGLAIIQPALLKSWLAGNDLVKVDAGSNSDTAIDGKSPDAAPSENHNSDDNPVSSDLKNPLTRSLDAVMGSNDEVFRDDETGLRSRLEEADTQLSRAKYLVRQSIRKANRQVRTSNDPSPIVLLIVLEGGTKDDLGIYGDFGKTPLLEGLAESGTVFSACYGGPTPAIARHMLLTGQGHSRSKPRTNRLAEMAWNSGYEPYIATDTNWMRQDELKPFANTVVTRVDEATLQVPSIVVNGAEARVIANTNDDPSDDTSNITLLTQPIRQLVSGTPRNQIAFAQLHLTIRSQETEARQAEILEMDQAFGRLINDLKKSDSGRSVNVLLTGLPNRSHHQTENDKESSALAEANLQVPLMLYRSQDATPGVIETPCGLLDILPTLADCMNSARVPSTAGTSLVSWIDRRDLSRPLPERVFRFSDPENPNRMAIRRGPWKAIIGTESQLFFLPDDPHEQRDVSLEHVEILQSLSKFGRIDT